MNKTDTIMEKYGYRLDEKDKQFKKVKMKEAALKLQKVINSIDSDKQIEMAGNMIQQFVNMYLPADATKVGIIKAFRNVRMEAKWYDKLVYKLEKLVHEKKMDKRHVENVKKILKDNQIDI